MKKRILILGGAGFIGINAAEYFIKKKYEVIILDNFSRAGSDKNIIWLKSLYTNLFTVVNADIRKDCKTLQKIIPKAEIILHLAGQVAVTTSVKNPRDDFENNLLGTFNVLESIRLTSANPIFLYSSTNKVYGKLEQLEVVERKTRYVFKNLPNGVSEKQNLDFHSPYGCSKGSADQYVRDYSRIYGLNTIVFRQSCIYGPHQYGIEDQGWVAWFIIALVKRKNIIIYGNGKQVRDLLYIEDLLRAFEMAILSIKKTKGQIYNIGGGPSNTISIWLEFKPILENMFQRRIKSTFAKWRPGDQPIFVADISKAKKEFNWEPKVNVEIGIKLLYDWIVANN